MKKYLLLFVCIAAFFFSHSQDSIITIDGDTIDCKITRVAAEFIHFSVFDRNSRVLLMRSRLPLDKVATYVQVDSIKSDDTLSESPIPNSEQLPVTYEEFEPSKFRLSLTTGFTYQFGGYESWPDAYKNQLQTLWSFGGDMHYFLSDRVGVGLRYNYIFTRAAHEFQPPYTITSISDEKVRFTYFAPSLIFRDFIYDDQIIYYFVGGGIVNYNADGFIDRVAFSESGETFAIVLGVAYDFIFSQRIGVGFGAEVNISSLNEVQRNGVNYQTNFPLTRVDLTVGLRFLK